MYVYYNIQLHIPEDDALQTKTKIETVTNIEEELSVRLRE
jgi:hypothetical protein